MSKKMGLCIFSAMLVFSLIGCSSGPTSPQKPWTSAGGNLVWVEDSSIGYVYETTLKTLQEMKFNITKNQQDGLSGQVIAKTLDNKKVVIDLKAETADWTRVTINVGFYWSNQDEARVIYEQITKNLEM